jgi:peptidoglycan hydrolase CwlO-like protein
MKRLEAIIAAAIITGVVALSMLLIGVNALLNPNSVPVSDSPVTTALNSTTAATTVDQAQVSQLQSLITQYQSREKQYQAQLDQANTQLEQYQQVLSALQSAGVIRITSDGQILLRRGRGGDD